MQLINVKAPFTPAQVQQLNEYQCGFGAGRYHPFTCLHREHGVIFTPDAGHTEGKATHEVVAGHRGLLIATPTGWLCPYCGYAMDWAFSFMCDRPARLEAPDRDKLRELIAYYTVLQAKKAPGAAFMVSSLEDLRERWQSLAPVRRQQQSECNHVSP